MRITVLTPWYPDYANVYSGVFVWRQVQELRHLGLAVDVEVPQIFPAPAGRVPHWVDQSMADLALAGVDSAYLTNDGATYIPTPVPTASDYLSRARTFSASLASKRRFLPRRGDIVHAHVAIPTALAAIHVGDDPLVVTEHFSKLPQMLRDPGVREAYFEVIERASALVCVSPVLKTWLVEALGDWAGSRITVIPNGVEFAQIEFRPFTRQAVSNWLYVGGLFAHKGVANLLRSFRAFRRHHNRQAHLVLVGEGPMRSWVESYTSRHKLQDHVEMVGQVAHTELSPYFHQADVTVHLSPVETFGLVSLESIAAGTPVVSLRNGGAEWTWGDVEVFAGTLLSTDSTPSQIASAVAALEERFGDLELREARNRIETRFDAGVLAERMVEVYEDARH